jgi:hypothetical protein
MPQDADREFRPDVRVWADPNGGVRIKAVTSEGEPVRLSSTQARRIAEVLMDLADANEA